MIKKIFVSGSSKGIGLTIAKKLLDEGNKVVINGRNKKKILSICKQFNFTGAVAGDLSKNSTSKKVVNSAIKILGGLDVLICNAGESKSCKPNKENYKDWNKMFNQNFFTTSNLIENSKKYLVASKGEIISISSAAGIKFIKGAPITYSTAKAAINFYLQSLSSYLGSQGVRVNIIAPGNILFKGSTWEKKIKKNKNNVKKITNSTVPLRRFGSRNDIAELVNYLISGKANYLNGSIITVDGGLSI